MPSTPTLRSFTHVSVSQLQSWSSCRRKWWFDKIRHLPRVSKTHFTFGTVLHECAERVLRSEEPFPQGWESKDLSAAQLEDIKGLITGAVERGILTTLPMQMIEHRFELSMGAGRPMFIGFIDHSSLAKEAPIVIDHKTTGDLKWSKTLLDLLEDMQMLAYAFAMLQLYREKYLCEPPFIAFRHNLFVKGLQEQDSALSRALTDGETKERWRIVGGLEKEEAKFTVRQLEEFWVRCIETVEHMMVDAKVTDWRSFPDPPISACKKYALRGETYGCDFHKICHAGMSMSDYEDSLNPKDATSMSTKNAASALAKFGKKRGTVKPKPKQPAVTNPEPDPEPVEAVAPPWHKSVEKGADKDCVACEGSKHGPGFKRKKPEPCGVCVMWAKENEFPLPEQFSIHVVGEGRPTWHLIEDDNGDTEVNGPVPEVAEDTPSADLTKFDVDIDSPTYAKTDVAPARRGRGRPKGSKNKSKAETKASGPGFELALNCRPLGRDCVMDLADFFYGRDAHWAGDIAEGMGEARSFPWAGLDPFKRMDAACGMASTWAEQLDGMVIVANTGSHEFRRLIDALRPLAKDVWVNQT